jgi:hypothetical protein
MVYDQKELSLHLKFPVKCNDQNNHYQCLRQANFDFTLPFHAGHVTTPHQAINLNGKTLTLEKVLVVPSETRLYMDGFSINDTFSTQAEADQQIKTFTAKHFTITLSNGKKTYPVCTVTTLMCGRHDIPSFEADKLKEIAKDAFSVNVGKGASVVVGSGEFMSSLNLGNDRSVIGLTLPKSLIDEHGNWTITVQQTVAQLILQKDPKTGITSYVPAGPYVIDPSTKPWVFMLHLP